MPRRQRQRKNAPRSMKTELHRRLRGVEIKPGPDPTPIKYSPWNSVTLVHIFNEPNIGEFTYTPQKVISDLKSQLGISSSSGTYFVVRINKVRVWFDIAGVDLPVTGVATIPGLKLHPYTFIGNGPIATISDFPSNVQWARAGFEWPDVMKDVVWRENGSYLDDIICKVYMTAPPGASDSRRLLIYLDILWATDNTSLPSMLRDYQVYDPPTASSSVDCLPELGN